MEKPKRNSQQRPFFSLLFITLIFIVGFALGIFAFKTYENNAQAGLGIAVAQASESTSCIPSARDYPEPVVDLAVDDEAQQSAAGQGAGGGGGGGSANTGGVVSVASTATALSSSYAASPAPNITGGQNAPVPTSVALMATPVGGNSSQAMTIPGTYTPQPSNTAAPLGTQAPQMQGTAYPATSQTQTQLTNPLSAGEIDDNEEWDVYLTYRENFAESGMLYSPIDDIDVRNRQLIQVVDSQGEGILGAMVEVFTMDGTVIQTSCTYADGFTMFLPNAYEAAEQENRFRLRVSKNQAFVEVEMPLSSEIFSVELDAHQSLTRLDLLFLIDATGSMDDEIAAITNNILYISQEIDALPDAIDVRYALVSFKDPYYPTQVWDFTSDVNLFQSQLATLYTAGGDGETLNDGLDRSVHQVHWRGGDTIKLVFMIGDEPPGIYAEHPSYSISMLDALYAGIKVHPIASSGLDLQGEYIFRQVAQATMGNFIFLSYDNGTTAVQGGDPSEGSVAEEPFGQYNVAVLHQIVLNLIREELGFEMEE